MRSAGIRTAATSWCSFGGDKWGGSNITVFASKDLEKWDGRLALNLPGWALYNTSVCNGTLANFPRGFFP